MCNLLRMPEGCSCGRSRRPLRPHLLSIAPFASCRCRGAPRAVWQLSPAPVFRLSGKHLKSRPLQATKWSGCGLHMHCATVAAIEHCVAMPYGVSRLSRVHAIAEVLHRIARGGDDDPAVQRLVNHAIPSAPPR